MATLKAD